MFAADQLEATRASRIGRQIYKGPVAVLVTFVLLAAALFVITTIYARAYRRMQEANSRHWFQRGQSELKNNRPQKAAESFRNALSFRRDPEYLFRLSQALVAAGEYQEARGYLLSLWDRQPGRGELNLALARLDGKAGLPESAIRYYQNAIYGVWDNDPEQHRRDVRFELADFLLARGDRANAEADLIALTTALPHDFANSLRIAGLFRASGDNDRALHYYEEAARLEPTSLDALIGAGNTAFALANYSLAEHYLARAAQMDRSDQVLAQELLVVQHVLRMDPLQRGLSTSARAHRTMAAWKMAISTISSCATQQGLDVAHNAGPQSRLLSAYSDLAALKPDMREQKLASTEGIETALGRIAAAEMATAASCGELRPQDRALQLIAKMHGFTPQ